MYPQLFGLIRIDPKLFNLIYKICPIGRVGMKRPVNHTIYRPLVLFDVDFVGVIRLERTTTCTPCKYASQLRHTPIIRSANLVIPINSAIVNLKKYVFFRINFFEVCICLVFSVLCFRLISPDYDFRSFQTDSSRLFGHFWC